MLEKSIKLPNELKSRCLDASSISMPIGVLDAATITRLSLCAIDMYVKRPLISFFIAWATKNCAARSGRVKDL